MAIYKDKILLLFYSSGLFFLVVAFSLVYVGLFDIKTMLVIHFNPFSGIDFLGERRDVYGILLAGGALLVFHGFLSNVFCNREKFLARLIGFSAAFFSLLILLAIGAIVEAN